MRKVKPLTIQYLLPGSNHLRKEGRSHRKSADGNVSFKDRSRSLVIFVHRQNSNRPRYREINDRKKTGTILF